MGMVSILGTSKRRASFGFPVEKQPNGAPTMVIFSPVGFKGHPALLDIFLSLFSSGLKQTDAHFPV